MQTYDSSPSASFIISAKEVSSEFVSLLVCHQDYKWGGDNTIHKYLSFAFVNEQNVLGGKIRSWNNV